MALGDSLQKYTYQYLLEKALSQVSDDIDKREGSIIYDALAPACYVLAEYFMEVHRLAQEISIETASGEWLDNKVLEVGITRNQSTAAVRVLELKRLDISGAEVMVTEDLIGKRFSVASETQPLYYVITDFYRNLSSEKVDGYYRAECETPGIIGNQYTGAVIPLDFISNLTSAQLTDTIITGTDNESDEELRERYLTRVKYRSFGGNVAQYRELARNLVVNGQLAGIGGVQVYPTWNKTSDNPNGGGTVKLSVINTEFLPFEDPALELIQTAIDPDVNGGKGLGMAPIDHRVTVVTPEKFEVSVSAKVVLSGKTVEQVQPEIKAAIEAYFAQLRAEWDNGTELNEYRTVIYQSQVVRAVLSNVDGVIDLSEVTLNGYTGNITLEQSAAIQKLPVLKDVILNG